MQNPISNSYSTPKKNLNEHIPIAAGDARFGYFCDCLRIDNIQLFVGKNCIGIFWWMIYNLLKMIKWLTKLYGHGLLRQNEKNARRCASCHVIFDKTI